MITQELYQLIAQNYLTEIEEQLVAQYLGGLQQPLEDVLSLHSLWIVSEVYQHALIVEKQKIRMSLIRSDQSTQVVYP